MGRWETRCKEFKRLWNYSLGFYGVWIAHTGRRTGLFEAIAKRPVAINDLARNNNLNKDAVAAWCSAAESFGFLKKRGKKLYLPKNIKEILLDKEHPMYLGGQFSYLALRSLEYGALEHLIRTGQTVDACSSFDAIIEATDWDHNAFLLAIRHGKNRKLHLMLSRGCALLDVGCGTGTFIEKLLSKYPRSSFVGVEPSNAAHKAMDVFVGSPVKILRLAGEEMDFEKEFDLVYLGESLYATSDKLSVLSNCYRALRKGGIIAIVEGLLPKKVDEESRLIMGMQLDFALQGHTFMTKGEITSLLKQAGFSKIVLTHYGGSLYLAIAEKP